MVPIVDVNHRREQLLARFIPGEPDETSSIERWRARFIVEAAIALGIIGPLFSLGYFFASGSVTVAAIFAALSGAALLVPFVMRWTKRRLWAGHLLNVIFLAALAWLVIHDGGFESGLIAWAALAPAAALLFGTKREGLVWLVSVVGVYAGLHLAEGAGLEIVQVLPEPYDSVLWHAGLVGLTASGFTVVMLSRNLNQTLLETIEQKEAQTRAILESAADGIVTSAGEGRILTANRAAEDIFDCREEGLVGCKLSELIPTLGRRDDVEQAEVTLTRYKDTQEHMGRRPDGELFPLELSMGGLRSGTTGPPVLVFRDITERKRVEENLRQARDQALEASQAKSTFLANMSHELRTPLNAVIGYSEMLMEVMDEDGLEGYRSDLERIHVSGKHLLGLVDDILDLSKIEAGKMEAEMVFFSVGEMLDDIRDTVAVLAKKKDNAFEVDAASLDYQVKSDQGKIRQILLNLLGNACKFTEQGKVTLHARLDADSDTARGELVFTVSDTGIGMSSEALARIFEAFNQADNSTTREYGGTGLGLTITQHFCEMLGGELDVDSVEGEGTTFTMRLPVELGEATAKPVRDEPVRHQESDSRPPPEPTPAPVRPEILLVRAASTTRALQRRTLERDGFRVSTAGKASEALSKLSAGAPQAIVVDIGTSVGAGLKLLHAMAHQQDRNLPPVILLSDRELRSKEAEFARAFGLQVVVADPGEPQQRIRLLRERVGAIVGQREYTT